MCSSVFLPSSKLLSSKYYLQNNIMPRRDRTDPLQDAEDAINKQSRMSADARYSLLSSSIITLSESQRITLLKKCIHNSWVGGANFLISGLPATSIDDGNVIFKVITSDLSEKDKIDIVRSLMNKGCTSTRRRKTDAVADAGHFIVFTDRRFERMIYSPLVLDTETYSGVPFVQDAVQKNEAEILSLILPKLDTKNLRLVMIESIGGNVKRCCDILVDHLASHQSQIGFAALLATIYNRVDLLSSLLSIASTSSKETLKKFKFTKLHEFSPFPLGSPQEQTVADAAVYYNNPDCLDVLLDKKNLGSTFHLFSLLRHCVENNFVECSRVILKYRSFNSKKGADESRLVEILHTAIRCRCNPSLIFDLIKKMKNTTGCDECLENILFKCLENRWYEGLFVLVSKGFQETLGDSDEIVENAEKTLKALVLNDIGAPTNDIIKHLVSSLAIYDVDLEPIFTRLLLVSKNCELVEFLMSLGKRNIFDVAKKLRPIVTDTALKKVIDAKNNFKVKLEVVKEEDEEDEDEEEEEDEDEEEEPVVQVVATKKAAPKKASPKKAAPKKAAPKKAAPKKAAPKKVAKKAVPKKAGKKK